MDEWNVAGVQDVVQHQVGRAGDLHRPLAPCMFSSAGDGSRRGHRRRAFAHPYPDVVLLFDARIAAHAKPLRHRRAGAQRWHMHTAVAPVVLPTVIAANQRARSRDAAQRQRHAAMAAPVFQGIGPPLRVAEHHDRFAHQASGALPIAEVAWGACDVPVVAQFGHVPFSITVVGVVASTAATGRGDRQSAACRPAREPKVIPGPRVMPPPGQAPWNTLAMSLPTAYKPSMARPLPFNARATASVFKPASVPMLPAVIRIT